MNIALLGYGKMGKAIEKIAIDRGHTITLKVGSTDNYSLEDVAIDVAIDFSVPEVATSHITNCLSHHTPVVSGTTGWLSDYQQIIDLCQKEGGAFLYASNFSVGVNVFFEINQRLAQLLAPYKEYQTHIEEIHHTQKLDAPSGTAITLAEGIINQGTYDDWSLTDQNSVTPENNIPITSKRIGTVPGTHIITHHSAIDDITLTHEAHSRQGFALGAVIAAEWIIGKKGVFSMRDVLNIS